MASAHGSKAEFIGQLGAISSPRRCTAGSRDHLLMACRLLHRFHESDARRFEWIVSQQRKKLKKAAHTATNARHVNRRFGEKP
jgi:hypothetical protein